MKIKQIEMTEVNEAVKLHNSLYNDKRTAEEWIWEYEGNYPELSVFAVLKNEDEKIIGTQGMIPIYININSDVFLSGKSESSLLHPKYRGGDLFKNLYNYSMSLCEKKKMSFVWGFTFAVKVLGNKLGFSVFENAIYESMLIVSLNQFISSVQKSNELSIVKVRDSAVAILLSLNYLFKRSTHGIFKHAQENVAIEEKLRSTDDISELYRRLGAKARNLIYLSQDEKYIAWRVLNNPSAKYITLFAYKDNSLGAYCYVALRNNDAYIADLTFERYDVADLLLKRIIKLCQERNIRCLFFMGNIRNSLIAEVFDLLKRNGFTTRRSTPFVLKNISYSNEHFLNDFKNWYVNGLWTEGFLY